MHETLERALTREEREEAMRLFGESDLDSRLRNEPTSDENLRRNGAEAALCQRENSALLKAVKDASKRSDKSLTYAVLDVDKMTYFNKRYGRGIGDKILNEIKEVVNYVLKERSYEVGKPTGENKYTVGDQLYLILNYAGLQAEEDINEVLLEIRSTVASRIYHKLKRELRYMPVKLEGLKKEEITVSIGYVPSINVEVFSRRGEQCTLAELLKKGAIHSLGTVKKNGGNRMFGLN